MDIDFETPTLNAAVTKVLEGLLWDYMASTQRELKTIPVVAWKPGVFSHPSLTEADVIPAKLYCLKHFLIGISNLEPIKTEKPRLKIPLRK